MISAEYFPNRSSQPGDIDGSRIISRIAEELRVAKRTFKIIFTDAELKDNQVVSNLTDPETLISNLFVIIPIVQIFG